MSVRLALYPNARGLGYACLELPNNLIEYGIVTVRPMSNERALKRMEKFIDFFKPEVIIVRDAEISALGATRMSELLEGIRKLALERNLPVHSYARHQVKDVFEVFGAKTKYGIAQKIITWFPQLSEHAPRIRRPWMDEDYYMGIFDALALAICHAYLTE